MRENNKIKINKDVHVIIFSDIMFEKLKMLSDAPSISGYEDNIRDILEKQMKKHMDEVKTDKVGNLIARKGKGSPVIMVAAHMDKIGLIVKHVKKEGYIIFDKVGGWDERIIPARKVIVHGSKGPVTGVIGSKPVHLQEDEERKKPARMKDMFIDIGASSEGDVKKLGISVGDPITQAGGAGKLSGSKVTGNGFDNRIGCLVIHELARLASKFTGTLVLVGTVKEEIGLLGIRGSAYGVNPDVLLAVDTTIGGDVPGLSPEEVPIKLGGGPSLELKDAINVISPSVRKWVTETASKNKIKIQIDVSSKGATDASMGPSIREGIPSGALSVPVRYIHTPVEVADMKDIENCVKLYVKLTETAKKYF